MPRGGRGGQFPSPVSGPIFGEGGLPPGPAFGPVSGPVWGREGGTPETGYAAGSTSLVVAQEDFLVSLPFWHLRILEVSCKLHTLRISRHI